MLGYDDSPGARRALAAAVGLANERNGQVTAVAVEAHLPHAAALVGEVEEELAVEDETCRRWLSAAESYAAEHGVTLATEVRRGHPAQELLRAAEAHEAELLILGHSGHSAIWGRFLGSTAEKLCRHARCSVLLIR